MIEGPLGKVKRLHQFEFEQPNLLTGTERLHACRHHDIAGGETLRYCDRGGIEAQHIHFSDLDRQRLRIDNPHGRMAIELGQGRRRDLDHRHCVCLQRSDDGCPEPHGVRRIGEAHLDLKGPRDGIGLRRNLAYVAGCRNRGVIGETNVDGADQPVPSEAPGQEHRRWRRAHHDGRA